MRLAWRAEAQRSFVLRTAGNVIRGEGGRKWETHAVEVHPETADVPQDRRGKSAVERTHAACAEYVRCNCTRGRDARLCVRREVLLLFLLLGLD